MTAVLSLNVFVHLYSVIFEHYECFSSLTFLSLYLHVIVFLLISMPDCLPFSSVGLTLFYLLQEKTGDHLQMPSYFRFLTLLAFKIFLAEQVKFTLFFEFVIALLFYHILPSLCMFVSSIIACRPH